MEQTGPSLAKRALAVVILLLAAWILIKIVVGIVAAVFWVVLAVVAVVAVLWAINTLF
jgi:predicted membrane protein